MVLKSYAQWSPCVNPLADPTRKQDKLVGQGLVRGFNAESDEAPIKVFTSLKAPIPPLILPFIEDLFTKFMKVFMKTMQA